MKYPHDKTNNDGYRNNIHPFFASLMRKCGFSKPPTNPLSGDL